MSDPLQNTNSPGNGNTTVNTGAPNNQDSVYETITPTNEPTSQPSSSGFGMTIRQFVGGQLVVTTLSMLLLVGGLGVGVVLVTQQQNLDQKAANTLLTCSEDCSQMQGVNGAFTCNATTGKCQRNCLNTSKLPSSPVDTYYCDSGNVVRSELAKDPDPLCSDYQNPKVIEECGKSSENGVTTYKTCDKDVYYNRDHNGYKITRANTHIYTPGNVACVTTSIVKK